MPGCLETPCNMGSAPSDIRVVANVEFLDANPAAAALFEMVRIPLEDNAAQNVRMRAGETSTEDIRRHAEKWIEANRDQVEGILDVRSESTVRWLHGEFGAGFSRGTRTALVLDRDRFVGSSPMLFSAVVERFLALYCAMNSFSELVLETPQDHGEVHRWSPRAGERVLL